MANFVMLTLLKPKRNRVDFIKSNILLIGLAIGSATMLLIPMFKKNAGGVPNLTAPEAVTFINRSNALVLDVRDDAEFAAGRIADAMHIPLTHLEARLGELKKYKNKAILVNCQRGARSAKACDILRKADFTQVSNLQGGLSAWVSAKLPVVKQTNNAPAKAATKAVTKKLTANTVAANDEIVKDPS